MRRLRAAVTVLCLLARPAFAHRLDEYLQATILSFEPSAVQATLRMVPGVAVAPEVITRIDSNHDGLISGDEQRRYAETVLADLQLREDGQALRLHLRSAGFPGMEQMQAGTGEIEIAFSAALPAIHGQHELTYENHHRSDISVYLVNSLIPENNTLQLGAQARNQNQSFYRVALADAGVTRSDGMALGGFAGAYRLGVRHIAQGTDHLLFLLTLLLPAPLLAFEGRWANRATVRQSLVQIMRIVTAFTVGHSLTLALSVFGLVRLPGRPVEVLIAISILISAIHAMRPLFPGREVVIAAFFGLVHGLAFASALSELGLTGWYRITSLFGFNIGIEAMQLAVVAGTLPALVLLSRTRFYSTLRVAGATIAIVASMAWILERVLERSNAIGDVIDRTAQHGLVLACLLWGFCLAAWLTQGRVSATLGEIASHPSLET